MDWDEFAGGKSFVMDLGEDVITSGPCCRYAAWIPNNEGKGHRIVEVSNDLNVLQQKYVVANDMILLIKQIGKEG